MAPGGLPCDDLSAPDNTLDQSRIVSRPPSETIRAFFQWLWPSAGSDGREDRVLIARILFAIVWLPIQVVLSLFFAVGGLMLVLILGLILGPFIALFFLIRSLVWKPAPSPDGPAETGPPAAGGRPGDVSHP